MRRAALFALLVACGQPSAPPPESATLGGDAVARVGDVRIAAPLVAAVATSRGLSARDALAALIDDALAAEGARARGLGASPSVEWAFTATRARAVATRLRDAALAAGPPSEEEIEQLTAFHWLELDLPEQVRVVHAIVMRPKQATTDAIERAKALAAEILTTVATAASSDDFEERAKAVPHPGQEVVVQTLPPFVEDRRVAAPGNQQMDPAFTAAAFALKTPGATSAVVESAFGWHVIRLVERLPAKRVPLEERRARLTEEVYVARARGAREELIASLRAKHAVTISPAAETMMGAVSSAAP